MYVSIHNLLIFDFLMPTIIYFPHIHWLRCFSKNSGFVEVIAHKYVLSVKSSLDEQFSSGTLGVHLRENFILSATVCIS